MTATVSQIAIYRKSDGALVANAPLALKPTDPAQGWVALPASYSDDTHAWDATARAWIEDVTKVRGKLIASVKVEAETRKMAMMTPGGAKKTEYDAKRAEVLAWDGLGGTVTAILLAFNGLTSARRLTMFAYAIADAAAFGDQPADAIARFRAGMTAGAKVQSIAAVEAKACAAIKAATSPAAARAAITAIVWP